MAGYWSPSRSKITIITQVSARVVVTLHFSFQVVIVGRNSLNNRFLPYSNIETEAVLALDDDQSVPFNQLELAFRCVP